MAKKITSHLVKGLFISLFLILVNLVGQLSRLIYQSWFNWLWIILFLLAVALSTVYFGRQLKEDATFGVVFTHGFRTTAVIACLVFVYTWFTLYLFFPGFVQNKVQMDMGAGLKYKTGEELTQYTAIAKKVFLAGNLMTSLIAGVAGSLLGATFTKSNHYHSTNSN